MHQCIPACCVRARVVRAPPPPKILEPILKSLILTIGASHFFYKKSIVCPLSFHSQLQPMLASNCWLRRIEKLCTCNNYSVPCIKSSRNNFHLVWVQCMDKLDITYLNIILNITLEITLNILAS